MKHSVEQLERPIHTWQGKTWKLVSCKMYYVERDVIHFSSGVKYPHHNNSYSIRINAFGYSTTLIIL